MKIRNRRNKWRRRRRKSLRRKDREKGSEEK